MKLDEYIKTRGNVDVAPQELDKLLGVKVGRQKPNIGEKYWFIDDCGNVEATEWANVKWDNCQYCANNCFPTMEAAEQKLRVIQTDIELRKYAEKHNEDVIDWTNNQQAKWRLNYDFPDGVIGYIRHTIFYTPNQIYFTSEEIARTAVNEIGKERVTEYLKYGSGIDD